MALRISATMALCLVFYLMAVAHCAPLEETVLSTNASSVAVPAAEVHAVPDEQGLLRLPSSDDSIVPGEVEEPVKPVAEPDPDRSHPSSDSEEDLTAKKLSPEGQQDDGKTKEQIDDDEGEEEEEEEKKIKKNNHDGDDKEEKKKRKKQHHGDDNGKKEKKTKKHHQSSEEEEEDEEKMKKKIHRHHHHVEKENTKTKKRRHHIKNSNGDDSDDDGELEKKAKRWMKKAISRSRFSHGRRSQREEAQTEEGKN